MSTSETTRIAERAAKDKDFRDYLIQCLEEMSQPVMYSNQDFDRKQHLSSALAAAL